MRTILSKNLFFVLTLQKILCIITLALLSNIGLGTRRKQLLFGSIAQLGEHLPYKQRVIGSSPIVPTKKRPGSSVG